MFLFRHFGHVRRHGPDESIAKQNAQKCPDQRRCDFVSNFFRRTTECAHRDDYAKHGSHDS